MPLRTPLAALALLVAFAAPTPAQTFTWNRTTDSNWNDPNNWLEAAVPTSGTTTALVFNATGTTAYIATNDIGPLTLNSLTVNNTGTGLITLAGPAANTLTFAGTDPSINVTAGSVLFTGLLAGSPTITKTGAGTFVHDSDNAGFTGTLVINGGTFVNQSTVNAVTRFNPGSIVVNNGGTYQFGNNGVGDPNLPNNTYITINTGGTLNWQEGEQLGGINLQGGTINFQLGNITSVTSTGSPNVSAWTSGVVTGGNSSVGGALPINKTTAGTVTISGGASVTTTGAFNIQEGTVTHVNAANLGTSNITLGDTGGTTAGTFEYQGGTASRAGTFAVNAGGGTIRVSSASSTLTLSGNFSGAGPLTKDGAGTLHLTGALNNTGTTTVAAGTLRLNPATPGGGFAVANGATLAVNSGAGTASLTVPTLSLGSTGSAVRFELTGAAVPTAPLLVVSNTDGLTLNGGTHTLGVTSTQAIPTGTFTLIDYTGAPISSGFNLSLPGRTAGSLTFDTANTRIDVTITGSDTVKWTGAVNGNWDVGTAPNTGGTNNWQLVTAGTATNFIQTDTVTFDDTATGFTVNVATAVQPASVLVNTANTYTFQGTGSIAGATALTKQGTGTLILNTANTYTGGTTIAGGVLQINSNASLGDDSGAVVFTGGTLQASTNLTLVAARGLTVGAGNTGTLDAPTNVNLTVAGIITGTGTLNKTGAGTLTLLGNNNPFTGTVNVNGGILLLDDQGAGGDLAATSVVINNGGTFVFGTATGVNPDLPAGTILTVNTGGVAEFNIGEDYGGIRLQGGAYNSQVNNNLGSTSVLESGTITRLTGATGGSLAGAGFIQKTTAGTVTITGVELNNTGGLGIEAGVLSTDAAIGGSGDITLGVTANATLQYRGATATVGRPVSLAANTGTLDVTQSTTAVTLSGIVSGAGQLAKTGAGTLILTGNNTYTGATTVSGGTLLSNGQTGTNSGTGTGNVSVNTGGTLGGTGRVAGAVTVGVGGAIRGGAPGGTGTLTVANNVTINSSAGSNGVLRGEASRNTGVSGNADASLISVTGAASVLNLNPGGGNRFTIDLVNGTNVLQIGETYTITLATVETVGNIQLNGASQGANATIDPSNYVLQSSAFGNFNNVSLGVNSAGTGLVLTFQPVPEPVTVLGLAAGALGLGGLIRRRLGKTATAGSV